MFVEGDGDVVVRGGSLFLLIEEGVNEIVVGVKLVVVVVFGESW